MKNTVHLSSIENGKIKEIKKEDGSLVKKDDVILELETVESTQEKIEWENQLKKNQELMSIMIRYIESIK